jgi:hypothetical protein
MGRIGFRGEKATRETRERKRKGKEAEREGLEFGKEGVVGL